MPTNVLTTLPHVKAMAALSKKAVQPKGNTSPTTASHPLITGKAAQDILKRKFALRAINLNVLNLLAKFPGPINVGRSRYNVFNDRYKKNVKWILPEYEIVLPEKPFFNVLSTDNMSSLDSVLFQAMFSIEIKEKNNPAQESYLNNLRKIFNNLVVNKIPIQVSGCELVIYWNNRKNHASVRGVVDSQSKFSFDLHDTNDFSSVRLCYRNISNYQHGKNEYADLILYGNFMAYMKVVGVYTKDNNYIYQKMSYSSEKIKVSVPCSTANGSLFTLKEHDTTKNIGCMPPWDNKFALGSFYDKKEIAFTKATIFQSNIQPQIFLIIPNQYLLDRDGSDHFRPSVDLVTQLNPDEGHENENITILNFYIKPDLSRFDLKLLEQLLQEFCPSTKNEKYYPLLKMPNYENIKFELSSNNIFKTKELPLVPSSSGYYLTFYLDNSLDIIKAGGLIPKTLATKEGYSRSLTYTIDEQNKAISTVLLSFAHTTGDIVTCTTDPVNKKIAIHNPSQLSLQLLGVIFYNQNQFGYKQYRFKESIALDASQDLEIPFDQITETEAAALNQFQNIEIDYVIKENPDDNLNESRICVDNIKQTIVISTNIKPSMHNLKKIEVVGVVEVVNLTLTSVLIPENDDFNPFHIQNFNLSLPLSEQMRKAENQVLSYTIKFYFNDGTSKISDKKTLNFNTNPSIFIDAAAIPQ